MRRIMGKRGQEMSISTLVLIVIAIVVLVLVVIGFTGGWNNLWGRIIGIGGGSNNVQSIIQACEVACTTGASYDYTQLKREVRFDGDRKVMATCKELESGKPARAAYCEVLSPTNAPDNENDCKAQNGKWMEAEEGWPNPIITDKCQSLG